MTLLDLDRRTGWPEDMRVLLDLYPREVWPAHANLGRTARFWLKRHDMFRELGGALQSATAQFREGLITPSEFQGWFAPRLQFFLSGLNDHHHIEDHAYFPLFRAAEPRLVRGFEVLENDHDVIHQSIEKVMDAANDLLRNLQKDSLQRSADHYADVSDCLLSGLIRHLDDEEDLIIPLILDRSEEKLGM
ncbi:hemerythrin domain-containing protein [Microvirga alba]|uniref:Hemerythrin domain-containing protein n=1 Tax=Microvirga alba TaxID=2791025 RepID=A0A931BW34_9HYPH|nr:hemerythrin domain-containing protein [Microvirga alba]MBF9234925.1 hemerythrin domain-containing protein [Microvirga alba]